MDIKGLNEEIFNLIEKDISPEFRDQVKQYADMERNQYLKDVDYYKSRLDYNPDDEFYKDALDRANKKASVKNMYADKIYKYLAEHNVDVQNCTIESLDGTNLRSKDLKTLYFKAKKDTQTMVILLVPQISNFAAYELTTTDDGKFVILDLMRRRDQGVEEGPKPHSLKVALNSGVFDNKQLFLVSGPNLTSLRRQRRQSQDGMVKRFKADDVSFNVETDGDIQWALNNDKSFLDKSGYIVDYAKIKNKLLNFKKQKGSYSKDIDELLNGYDELMGKVKELFTNYNPRQGTSTDLPRIMDKMNNLGYILQKIDSNLETSDNGTSLKNYIDEAKRAIEDMRKSIEK